jgi:hypothetical protein
MFRVEEEEEEEEEEGRRRLPVGGVRLSIIKMCVSRQCFLFLARSPQRDASGAFHSFQLSTEKDEDGAKIPLWSGEILVQSNV